METLWDGWLPRNRPSERPQIPTRAAGVPLARLLLRPSLAGWLGTIKETPYVGSLQKMNHQFVSFPLVPFLGSCGPVSPLSD